MIDQLIMQFDTAIKTLFLPDTRACQRASPAQDLPENALSLQEKKHAAGLMRVNHAGEVCAQALYQGQALTASLVHTRQQMIQAAEEEVDHLAWCEQRLAELNSKPSVLNPLWYSGSLLLGLLAGLAGDKISLGFVAETERQVGHHLQKHLEDLPEQDNKSKRIVEQMVHDEQAHAEMAMHAGGQELAYPIKGLMSLVSKLMTKSSYYI